MWGAEKSAWLNNFQHALLSHYKIKFYDATKLGQLDPNRYGDEKSLHQAYIETGIDHGIQNLIRIEKEPQIYIACSIGGIMAWKAALEGLPIKKLIAISSTRLREESKSPNCDFQLFYGKDDSNKPSANWLNTFAKDKHEIINGDHDIYTDKEQVPYIIKSLLEGK